MPAARPPRSLPAFLATLVFTLCHEAEASAGPQEPKGSQEPEAGDAATRTDTLGRNRAYLARNPFHARVFEDLVAAAEVAGLAGGALAALTAEYEAEVAADPSALAPRVVLARLLARRGDPTRARALLSAALAELAEQAAGGAGRGASLATVTSVERLLASIELEAGDVESARARLTRLVAASKATEGQSPATLVERSQQEALLDELAELHDLAGDAEGLAASLRALAELVGDDVPGRLAVAARCEEHGLFDEAERTLRAALDACADDPVRRCNVLAALGRTLERRQRGEEALAAYDEAMALLAPGHWLREDLFDRALELRRVGGSLGVWLDERRSTTGDRAATLDVARALERLGRADEALELLAALAASRPSDTELADRLLSAARGAGRFDLALPIVQRRAADAPARGGLAARLQLELAEALAATGAVDGARLALDRAEAAVTTGDDVGALLTVAHRRAVLGDRGRAIATLESAARLAPTATGPLLELATLAHQVGDTRAHDAALARAAERAVGAERIEVAEVWLTRGRRAEGEALLDAALGDPKARLAALERLAQELLAEQPTADAAATDPDGAPTDPDGARASAEVVAARRERGRGLLRTLAGEARGLVRGAALDAYTRAFDGDAARREALTLESGRVTADPNDVVARLAVGRLATLVDDHARAADAYTGVLALTPDDLDVRAALVRSRARARDLDGALRELDELVRRDPSRRTEHLLERARLLAEARRVDEARETLSEVSAIARRSPDVLRQVGARLSALGDGHAAAEVLRRVLRLEPDDVRTARSLAKLEVDLGDRLAGARRLAATITGAATDDERAALLRDLEAALTAGPARDTFLSELVARTRANRFDREALELALHLLPRARRFAEVGEIAELVLQRAPDDPRGLAARSIARAAAGDVPGTLADLDLRVARGEPTDAVLEGLIGALRASDDSALAEALGARAEDGAKLAGLLQVPGYDQLTVDFLRGHVRAKGYGDKAVRQVLSGLHEALAPLDFALEAHLAIEAAEGEETIVRTHRIGLLHHKLGQSAEAAARGRRLVELGAPRRMVESYLKSAELGELARELFPDRAVSPGTAGQAAPGGG